MKKYLLVTKICILDTLQYRADFLLKTFKYSLMVLLMALVWIGVQKSEGATQIMNVEETVRYFFLATIIYSLSNIHTWYIEEDIKLGDIAKYLVKPISPILHYFFFEGGTVLVETIFKIIVIVPLLFIIGYAIDFEFLDVVLLLVYMPIIFIFTFNLYSLISGLSFWLQDAFAIRYSVIILVRLMSGIFVPISFFPEYWQKISFYLPFQHLAYTPIQMMNNILPTQTALAGLGILFIWIVVVSQFRAYVWHTGTKNFESTGI